MERNLITDVFERKSKFPMGQVVMTPGALDVFVAEPKAVMQALGRHAVCDWGDLDAEDKASNDAALTERERLLSAYVVKGTKIWVITEADRSSTTLLLPSEY